MDKEEAHRFKNRWRLVNERTAREWREASPEFKLQQLALMYEAAQTLGWTKEREADKELVRERWRRLREFYGVETSMPMPPER